MHHARVGLTHWLALLWCATSCAAASGVGGLFTEILDMGRSRLQQVSTDGDISPVGRPTRETAVARQAVAEATTRKRLKQLQAASCRKGADSN